MKSSLSQNSQYHSAFVSIWPPIDSASSQSQHTLFTLCHSNQTISPSSSLTHSSILPTCFTSSLEPASYITQNSSSKLFIPLSATFIWTCRFNLLHTAITFHHFFNASLWAQNLPFQKILSSTLVCFCCRTDLMALDGSPNIFVVINDSRSLNWKLSFFPRIEKNRNLDFITSLCIDFYWRGVHLYSIVIMWRHVGKPDIVAVINKKLT